MLFETLLQGKIFLCTLYFGLVCGILLTIKKIVDRSLKNKKVIVIITDVLSFVLSTVLFLICINLFNFGEIRLYEVVGFVTGIILQQISLDKLVEKFLQMLYNIIVKLFAKLKKSKIFGKVLK